MYELTLLIDPQPRSLNFLVKPQAHGIPLMKRDALTYPSTVLTIFKAVLEVRSWLFMCCLLVVTHRVGVSWDSTEWVAYRDS